MERQKKFSWLRRLLLVAACGFALFAVAMAVLIIPDQVRSIPNAEALVSQSILDNPEVWETLGARRRDGRIVEGSTSKPGVEQEAAPSAAPIEADLMAETRPVGDLYALTGDARTSAIRWNDAVDALTSRMLIVARSYAEIPYQDTLDELDAIGREFGSLYGSHFSKIPNDSRSDFYERAETWRQAMLRTRLAVATHHEDWLKCGETCARLSGWGQPDKTSPWWDVEIAYWRKAGLKGRVVLAARSFAPVFNSLFYAVAEPIRILAETTNGERSIMAAKRRAKE